ncbi:MAG: class I SAM-dependent methyltransferase [Clostridia bacterium]|nr:class I SAM-dependent methyltransferase [Clostridia bacterium]
MIDKVTLNAANPRDDEYGRLMLERMNEHHALLYAWGHGHISVENAKNILDVGCGGGKNLYNMAKAAPLSHLYGADISQASLKKTASLCSSLIKAGRLTLTLSDADALLYKDVTFDAVTAFETTYYWKNAASAFKNILSMLSPGGVFLVCNEDGCLSGNEEIGRALSMTFYSADELACLMRGAGFSTVLAYTHENGRWVCAVGRKDI